MSDSETPPDGEGKVVSFLVEEDDKRLDKVIRDRVPGLSRTQGQQLIEDGKATVDGRERKSAYRVESGERVTVTLPPPEPEVPVRPQAIPLDIIYEDEHLLGVNKPAGMVVHPAPGHPDGTLVNALLAHYPPIDRAGRRARAGIVHRLDKETSGVLVVAKKPDILRALQEQFRSREVEKTYLALVQHHVDPPEGIIEVPIGRDLQDRQRMTALADGKYARTRYCALQFFGSHTLLEVHPYTGRTHQVRVHLAWLGYPVVGDPVYGSRQQPLLKTRHFLHARRLSFAHPATGEALVLEAPLPPELQDVLEQLRPAGRGAGPRTT